MGKLARLLSSTSKHLLIEAQNHADAQHEELHSAHLIQALFEVDRTTAYDLLHEQLATLPPKRQLNPSREEIPIIIETAVKLAAHYRFSHVEPEHLLHAVLHEPKLVGYQWLQTAGTPVQRLRKKLNEWLYGVAVLRTMEHLSHEAGRELTRPTEEGRPGHNEAAANILAKCIVDLTEQAQAGQLDPVVGRQEELNHLIRTLLRRKKSNPLLIGDAGVGKTALVHGLAHRLVKREVPLALQSKRLLELSIPNLIAGTVYRGQFEERVRQLTTALRQAGNIIIFIDEIHTMTGAGSTDGALDLANMLKPLLASGDLTVIGATTHDEYRRYFSADQALERRFQPLFIEEPDLQQTTAILRSARSQLAAHHRCRIDPELIPLIVTLADRYLPDRFFPDKALDILDEAAAEAHQQSPTDPMVTDLQTKLFATSRKKLDLVKAGQLPAAVIARQQEDRLRHQLETAAASGPRQPVTVTPAHLARVVSRLAHVPESYILGHLDRGLDVECVERELRRRLVGQRPAITAVTGALRRAATGLRERRQPLASYIFLGPSGVGKTELARQLAGAAFGSSQQLIKIDMSELSERHTISNLIGSPKGYVGYDDGGSLVDRLRRRPHSVVLFDEVEKAHPDIFSLLLQILEDGELTDAHGRRAHFNHSIIVLTSNLGTEQLGLTPPGFTSTATTQVEANELADFFRPELLGRLTNVIHFHPFTAAQVRQLIRRRLSATRRRLREHGQDCTWDNEIVDWLAKQYDPGKGARSVDELVREKVENPLAVTVGKDGNRTVALTAGRSSDSVAVVKQ